MENMHRFLRTSAYWCILCLLTVGILDPADQMLHLKMPLFICVCLLVLIGTITDAGSRRIPLTLILYVVLFALTVPLISICIYVLRGNSFLVYDGARYMKSYAFLFFALVLAVERFNIVPAVSWILTAEAAAIVTLFFLTKGNPGLRLALYAFAGNYGIFSVTDRSYADLSFTGVYFATSPLLVISVAYFTFKCLMAVGSRRAVYFLLVMTSIGGMVLSGSRNNIVAGCLTPLVTWLFYSKKKAQLVSAIVVFLCVVLASYSSTIGAMLDPSEGSNAIKLEHLHDYGVIFSDSKTLLFGQGLGAFFHSTEYGFTSVTELTYFELIRNYGLILGAVVIGMLLYPLTRIWDPCRRNERYFYVAFGAYLYLSWANPFLISSSGMLILSIVAYQAFSIQTGDGCIVEENRVLMVHRPALASPQAYE
ncbi:MAG: hypothetical protein WAL45_16950 [Terracidiphilus sp.]